MTTPKGRVLVAGPAANAIHAWLTALLRDHGYDVVDVTVSSQRPGATTLSLSPIAVGFDLWRTSDDARYSTLAELDEMLPPSRPLLASCSSTSIDEISSFAVRPERVVGISIFGPRRPDMLLELVPGLGTESRMVRLAADFLAGVGLRSVALPPGSWAVLPRIVAMTVNEAAVVLAERVATAEDIDRAMTLGANYPSGPIALADEIGLADILAVLDALYAEYGDDRYRAAPLLRRMVLAGFTGRASGRGFYLYP